MQTLILNTPTGIQEKVIELASLGKLAKDLIKINNKQMLVMEVYIQMAHICNELRPFEPEFKVVYPMLSDLYDNLISLYDMNKNNDRINNGN